MNSQLKLLILIVLVSLTNTQAIGQKNRVNITINKLSYLNSIILTQDTLANEKIKSLRILPSFGYFRKIKNNIGIGCEFAFQKSNYKRRTIYKSSTNNNYEIDETTNPYNYLYVCPTIYENYFWKKYQIITSIILPFEYVTKLETYSSQYFVDNTNHKVEESFSKNINPKTLFWGVFCNLSINRLVFKNFYIGVQFGIGVSTDIRFGNGIQHNKRTTNGIVVEDQTTIQEFKKDYTGRLDYRPSISIHYNF